MKKFFSVLFLVVMLTFTAKAQWTNLGAFPDTAAKWQGNCHAIEVDPDGKIWTSDFYARTYVAPGSSDTLKSVIPIWIFNPDGTQASFSPIIITKGAVAGDTIKSNCRGMRKDQAGNILSVHGNQNMYRFDYKTGECKNKVALALGTSPLAPAVDQDGNIFVGPVVASATTPIKVFDTEFQFSYNALESTKGYARTMEVSKDGNTMYCPIYSASTIFIYSRENAFTAFDSSAVIAGITCESMTWHPKTGLLWVSAGAPGNPSTDPSYSPYTWYGFDVKTLTIKDSLKSIIYNPASAAQLPRAIAFSPDGNTAYIGCFGGAGYPLIQKLVKSTGVVKEINSGVVNGYQLSQNYPNPFNPTTNINFAVAKEGFVTLKVYNVLGAEVATLINKNMTSGNYSVDFDASKLASGTYIYQLNVNGQKLSNKMLLMK